MFFKAVARCQASATKCQASGATSIFPFVFKKKFWIFSWLLKTRKNKEEKGRKKKILPSSLFFYFLFSFSFLFFL